MQELCTSRQNVIVARYRFWNLAYREPFRDFLCALLENASLCEFAEKDNIIRDKIAFAVARSLRETLSHEPKLTLTRAVELCNAWETSREQAAEITAKTEEVQKITEQRQQCRFRSHTNTAEEKHFAKQIDYKFCGKMHHIGKSYCPAFGKICTKCQKKNHFAAVCKQKINVVEEDDDLSSSEDDAFLHSIQADRRRRLTALVTMNDCAVHFQIDTGTDVSTICQKVVYQDQVHSCSRNLVMWNKTTMTPVGEASMQVCNPKNGEVVSVDFIVVKNSFTCLFSLSAVRTLNLTTVNDNNFIANIATDADLGDLGTVILHIDPNIVLRPCRVPLALEGKLKTTLDSLVQRGVLSVVDEPTDFVSQMATVEKADHSLRICIDPQVLNRALKREHFRLPTLDDVLPKLSEAKVFSKCDVSSAFWHVKLDDPSRKLTTMITPFRRYCWNRLPFGLKVSRTTNCRLVRAAWCICYC